MLWIIATVYTALVSAIAYANYQLKLISAVVEGQPKIIDNKEFLEAYRFQIKINALLEKVWPRVKKANFSSVSSAVYKTVTALFVFLLLLQFSFPDLLTIAAPAMLLALGFLATIGNALQDKKKSMEINKKIVLPFSIFLPLFSAYQIDTSEHLFKFKAVLAAQSMGYDYALAALTIGLALFCYFGLNVIERFQRAIVVWVLKKAIILSQNMVRVGVQPTMPEEKEMRAIAKEAIVMTAQNMAYFGAITGAVVGCIKYLIV